MKNKNLLIIAGVGALLIYLFLIRKKLETKKQPEETAPKKDTEKTTAPVGTSGTRETTDLIVIRETGETTETTGTGGGLDKEKTTILNSIKNALIDYNKYCTTKGWKNKFNMADIDEIAKNIFVHFALETGRFSHIVANNLGNITMGSWNTKDPYLCSPYIRDIYGEKYILNIKRKEGMFRGYESHKSATLDYLDLINRTKRYDGIPKLYSQKDPVFIRELGRAGYFTADADQIYETVKKLKREFFNV